MKNFKSRICNAQLLSDTAETVASHRIICHVVYEKFARVAPKRAADHEIAFLDSRNYSDTVVIDRLDVYSVTGL